MPSDVSGPRNPTVSWLLLRAYGQKGTVALPAMDANQQATPRGQFPPGVEDMLDYLVAHHGERALPVQPSNDVEWCFLVGGPGNGKSEALRVLADRLGLTFPARTPGDAAPRKLPDTASTTGFPLPSGANIIFINDASIPRADSLGSGPGSLFRDILEATGAAARNESPPVVLFANVNRGVLIEESIRLPDASAPSWESRAAGIVRWLAEPPALAAKEDPDLRYSGVTTVTPVDPAAPYYGQFRVLPPDGDAATHRGLRVHAIFLDALSLLEPAPKVAGRALNFGDAPPHVAPYRTLGRLAGDGARSSTAAGGLLAGIVDESRWESGECISAAGDVCPAVDRCPFVANARWLRDVGLRENALGCMRAAEIAGGRRMTYRDLLGHLSLCMLGTPEESWLEGEHPCDWVRERRTVTQQGASDARAQLADLVSHRVYMNLFPPPAASSWRRAPDERTSLYRAISDRAWRFGGRGVATPFVRAFAQIDPALALDDWDGRRADVFDAVEALDVAAPSEQAAEWEWLPSAAHSASEQDLDDALRTELAERNARGRGNPDRERALRRWRSVLLVRQVGFALGHVAVEEAIHAWVAEHRNALVGNTVSQRLQLGLHNLVFPRNGRQTVYLAPFRPRTGSLPPELPPNTFLVGFADGWLRLALHAHGDALLAEVQFVERTVTRSLATFPVDLAIAREALLNVDRETASFTEIGPSAFARVERARAALLGRFALQTVPPLFTDAAGQVYMVSPGDQEEIPLRISPVAR